MNSTYKTIGIVIKRKDWRENDSLFSFYTQDFGKVEAIATSSKKITSKLAGHLSSFGLVDLMIARGKRIDRLAQARLIQKFPCDNIQDYKFFTSLIEFLDKAIVGHEADPAIWSLLTKTVDSYISNPNQDYQAVLKLLFYLKTIEILGYRPELYQCVICQKNNVTHPYFSFINNGLVCKTCNITKHSVSKESIILSRLLYDDQEMLSRVIFNREIIKQTSAFISKLLTHIFEKPFYSMGIDKV
ncbi:DNA repair protein RecO [Candidatus Falkowbacteria bacterium CG10_big_fil_rev_8_21_14_0_10_39_11]|uniref:DNA repair protein RecO n=1 Tax=Candidatus Falkowbacteria bacterium CG10_big_fil_rev_8_21_14_0_10_39_11 TaxID=1974565 RepID=A0A2H0V8G9_9BACT|nr:MAG: DNA repair protein RecO [Candidatus Falkowbacteria bacterium CG10_big_fil_rev_8_21_14_0_10_39_11]